MEQEDNALCRKLLPGGIARNPYDPGIPHDLMLGADMRVPTRPYKRTRDGFSKIAAASRSVEDDWAIH